MKPIPGKEHYLITEDGRVFNSKKGIYLKPLLHGMKRAQYYGVHLRIKSKHGLEKIHQLVAQAFIPNPNNLPWINHKDGNRLNNHKDNLEWCTPSQNMLHAHRMGLNIPKRKLTFDQVRKIRQLRKTGTSIHALSWQFNVHRAVLDKIFSNKTYKRA